MGLAGALNLYGFGNGDPVNLSDPFGLFGCPPDCPTFSGTAAKAVFDQLSARLAAVEPVMQAAAFAALAVPAAAFAFAGGGSVAALAIASTATRAGGAAAAVVSGLRSKDAARQALTSVQISGKNWQLREARFREPLPERLLI